MQPRSVGRVLLGLLVNSLFLAAGAFPQTRTSEALFTPVVQTKCAEAPPNPTRAYPFVELGCGRRIEFVGTYGDDGVFHEPSRLIALRNREAAPNTPSRGLRPAEVPRFIRLNPLEHVAENYSPSFHARQKIGGHRRFAAFLDGLVTIAYGRERALLRPEYLTTDSHSHLIVADPEANAVHVLNGERSFRIAGGSNRLLQRPAGVAVDDEDNIYVADTVRGLVEVYTSQGQFVRSIGQIDRDESLFELPTDIAIDRQRHLLYVLDFLRDRLFVMDLSGKVVDRIGLHRSADAVEFDRPTNLALAKDRIAVLDAGGSRVQVLDRDGKVMTSFKVDMDTHSNLPSPQSLAFDGDGNMYLNDRHDSAIHVYSSTGHLLNTFGIDGSGEGQFSSPQGLSIDASDRIYVADTGNRRVQVFQLQMDKKEPQSVATMTVAPSD